MATVRTEKQIVKTGAANKGGRPKADTKRNQLIGVKCSHIEKITIECKAQKLNLSTSEFLRNLGLERQVDRGIKALPKEVLQLMGTLNHMAANLNQIAHKRNRGDELGAIERAELMVLANEVKGVAITIKAALK